MSEAVAATGAEMVKKSSATWLEEKFGETFSIEVDGIGVFDFDRPVTWEHFEALGAIAAAVRIEGGDGMGIALATLSHQVTDTDGIPDFPIRADGETLDAFRARWRQYFGAVPALIMRLYTTYSELTWPTARQRMFRP